MKSVVPNSFLLDEVRCGFMVPSAVKQAWAAELEVLAEIDRVCKKHSIDYFADWGTLLGAIRHGGFIPWDDDLDIVMKRADYEKFLNVAAKDMEEGFYVQTNQNQKDYWLFMGKVVGRNYICFNKEHLQRFHNFPYIACVDIFVLDYVYREPEREENRRYVCKYLLGVAESIVEGSLQGKAKEKILRKAEELSGLSLKRIEDPEAMGRYLYSVVEKLFAAVPEDESDTLTQMFPWGLKGSKLVFPKEYYSTPIYVPFESITIPVPRLYNCILQKRYGNYVHFYKNTGAHDYPFFEQQKNNLLRVLDTPLPEFRFHASMLKRSEEELAHRENSYKALLQDGLEELQRIQMNLSETQDTDKVMRFICDAQQLAMDMGNLIEMVKGEGTEAVVALEEYCEAAYCLSQGIGTKGVLDLLNALKKRLQTVLTEINSLLDVKTVVFFLAYPEGWRAFESFYQEAKGKTQTDVLVVPIPYYLKDYDGSPKEICYQGDEIAKYVEITDYRQITPEFLQLLYPEEIYIQDSYDEWNPVVSIADTYHAKKLRSYTDNLIYVQPYELEDFNRDSDRQWHNMRYYVCMPGVVYADKVFVQSEQIRIVFLDKLTEFMGQDCMPLINSKLYINTWTEDEKSVPSNEAGTHTKKRLLYGIGLGTYWENEKNAQDKLMDNIRIFAENDDEIETTVFVYPELDNEKEKESLLKQFEKIRIQNGPVSIEEYDAFYGDIMPAMTQFIEKRKPVMIQNWSVKGE